MTTNNIIRVDDFGPIFELREPYTVESVQADAGAYSGRRGLCRITHRWEVIGKPYLPDDDPYILTLSLVASRPSDRLVRCKRCRCVSMRRGDR